MSANAHLPLLVQPYLERALPSDAPAPGQVQIEQTGEMYKKPGARAMRFVASERFAVDRVAFSWEARFPLAPLVSLRVVDGYADGAGSLKVRAVGIPVQTQSGHDVDVGEAFRYLAELPWVPHSMAANRELEWRELDDRSVEVSTLVGDKRPTVRLEFDEAGDIVRCVAGSRPRAVDGGSVPTGWGGELSDYRTLGGIRMPTRGEVYWELPEGRFVYWRGHVTAARGLVEPYTNGRGI